MPPARDSEEAVPVVRGASGAAAAFDGNHTSDIDIWMIPNTAWDDALVPAMLDELMELTAGGHLAWVVFGPYGFRV